MSEEIVAFAPQEPDPASRSTPAPSRRAMMPQRVWIRPRSLVVIPVTMHRVPGRNPPRSADNGAAPVPPSHRRRPRAERPTISARRPWGARARRDATRRGCNWAPRGVVLCQLGWALSEGQDETLTLQELVEAFDGRRIGKAGLRGVAPIVAAFIARTAAAPRLRDGSTASASEMESAWSAPPKTSSTPRSKAAALALGVVFPKSQYRSPVAVARNGICRSARWPTRCRGWRRVSAAALATLPSRTWITLEGLSPSRWGERRRASGWLSAGRWRSSFWTAEPTRQLPPRT